MWRKIAITVQTAALIAVGAAIRSVPKQAESAAPQPASATALAGGAPRASISDATVNVGEIPAGKPVLHEFVVANSGSARLEITAKPRCGCTVVDYAKSMEAGQESRIKLELSTRRLRGEFEKFVDVETNDPEQPKIRLKVAGRAVPAVEVKPSQSPVVQFSANEPTMLELTLNTADSVAVTDAQIDAPYAQAALNSLESGRYLLQITFQPETPFGRVSHTLMLTTTAEFQPQIPLTIFTEKGIIVSPPLLRLAVDRASAGDTMRGSVLLRNAGRSLRILEVVSPDESLEVEVSAVKEGMLYRLTATCRGEAEWNASPAITVKTDDPDQPLLTVTVRKSSRPSRVALTR